MTAAQGLAMMGAVFLASVMPRAFNLAAAAVLIGASAAARLGWL